MRILHVVASLIGGAAAQLTLLARAQTQAGHHAAVAAPDDCASGAARLQAAGTVPWTVWPADQGMRSSCLFALRTLARVWRPDIVHAHGQRAAVYARPALAGLRPRPRLILTWHGFHIPHYPRWTARVAATALEHLLFPWTDGAIFLTEHDLAAARVLLGARYAARGRVIPNGIDPPPPPAAAAALARQLGLPTEGPRIGAVLRLRPEKDPSALLAAFALLLRQHPNARLIVIGDGPLLPRLRLEAERQGIAPHVHWLGDREDARLLLPLFDVFVLPSLWEGLSLALLEAMDAGIPIVASDVPGNRAAVRHGENGLLAPPRNPAALACAINRILTDTGVARTLGAQARLDCERRFRATSMISATQQFYEDVLRR